jgi:uncharacterized protein YggT (Ycf19 family)
MKKSTVIRICRALVWIVYAWVAITIVLLFLGFLLQLLGADPTAGFVEWVYRSTDRAMAPFRGIFESVPLSDDSVLDISILFAIIVYCFVALGLNVALDWITGRLRAAEDAEEYSATAAARSAAAAEQSGRYAVHLAGADGSAATAVLSRQGSGTLIDVTVSGLDPTRTYTLWTENATGGRITAGSFQPSGTEPTRVALTSPLDARNLKVFGVALLGAAGEPMTDVLAARVG